MIRRVFIIIALLAYSLAGVSQESKIAHLLKAIDDYAKKKEHSGFDTSYVKVPEKDKMVFVGTNTGMQQYDLHFPILIQPSDFPKVIQYYLPSNVSDVLYTEPKFGATKLGMQLGINWHGISIAVPIPLLSSYSQAYTLAMNGRTVGGRVNYKTVTNLTGTYINPFDQIVDNFAERVVSDVEKYGAPQENHDPIYPQERNIVDGSMDLKIFSADLYYVFNNRKFSIAAGLSGNKMQKKSAGSFIAMMNYFQSRLGCNDLFAAKRDVFRNHILSIGLGYGYNHSMLNGRLCLHGSLIPMLSVHNGITHKLYVPEETEPIEGIDPELMNTLVQLFEKYHLHFYDGVDMDRQSKLMLNGFARFSLNYFMDSYLISVVLNYRRNMFKNSLQMTMRNHDADLRIRVGYRF